jgi:hypothetical protein
MIEEVTRYGRQKQGPSALASAVEWDRKGTIIAPLKSPYGSPDYDENTLKPIDNAKTKHTNDIRTQLAELTFIIGEMISAKDRTGSEAAELKLMSTRAAYKNSMESLERLEVDEEGKKLIAKLKEEIAKGKEQNDTMVKLCMTGNMNEAREQYAELTRNVHRYIEAAYAVVAYNEGKAQATHKKAGQYATFSLFWLCLLLAWGFGCPVPLAAALPNPWGWQPQASTTWQKAIFPHPFPSLL